MNKIMIFDADGMVVQGDMFTVPLQRDFGISPDALQPFFSGPFQECLIGKADLKETILPYIHKIEWTKSVDDFLTYWFNAENNVDQRIITDIKNLQERGIKCYLATNQEKYRAQYMLQQMGFRDVFTKVYVSCNIGHRKPSKEFFTYILNDLGNPPLNSIFFWDDTSENVATAKGLGIQAQNYYGYDSFNKKINKIFNVMP